MQGNAAEVGTPLIIERGDLQRLIDALLEKGYLVIGPIMRDGAIIYDEMTSVADLPEGWTDEQDGGKYRLKPRNDGALFGFNVGPHSWKKFLHLADVRLSQVTRDGQSLRFVAESEPAPKFAFIGARSCDLHAIAVQDKVFLDGPYVDPIYRARREQAFVIAVNCGKGGGTCFCVSMKTGPKASFGFDLAMTEVIEAHRHYFVVEVGTERGAEILQAAPHRAASESERRKVEEIIERTASQMGRTLDTNDIKGLLLHDRGRCDGFDGRARRAMAHMGFVLHG
jgi:hypothetical protein